MAEQVLTQRQLNRATLARQLLLERGHASDVDGVLDVIEQVAGLQAQEPVSPHLALWTRLEGFQPASLDQALHDRRAVKATLMRRTLHLVSTADYLCLQPALRASLAPLGRRHLRPDRYPPGSLERLADEALRHASEPRSNTEMTAFLQSVAGAEAGEDAWWRLRRDLPFVHVPAQVPWSFGRRPSFLAARSWLAGPRFARADEGLDHIVMRYLAAFGPATPHDLEQWSGIRRSRVAPALERLRPALRRFRDERGGQLFDIEGGPVPSGDVPAPPRFLPMWDNLLLAHADRARVMPEEHRKVVIRQNGDVLPTFLVDGRVAGLWRAEPATDGTTIRWEPFAPLVPAVRDAVEAEAQRLAAFIGPLDPAVYSGYTGRWIGVPEP